MSTSTITSTGLLADVKVLETFLANKQALRSKTAQKERKAAIAVAQSIIFGIFDRKCPHFGGDLVGSAVKRVLKAKNDGKSVKARTVTRNMIAGVTSEELMASLDAYKVTRIADLAERKVMLANAHTPVSPDGGGKITFVRTHSDEQIAADVKSKTEALDEAYAAAQQYINTAWPRIPSAMALIDAAGNGKIRTDDGEEKPTALALEMVLLNRSETARQFCKHVVRV